MSTVDNNLAYAALQCAGFFVCPRKQSLFLVDSDLPIAPAFHCRTVKRRGKIRFGGAIGIYFREFEHLWSDSLSKEDRRLDATLPLIMLIDNYMELIKNDVFTFSDDFDEILGYAQQIYRLCLKVPKSIGEFDTALISKKILDKDISNYLHIRGYHDSDDLYFRKSVSFIRWFASRWPENAQHMYQCLTNRQLQRLELK